MTMWIMIMWTTIAFVISSLFYLGYKVPDLIDIENIAQWGKFKQFSLGLLITLGVTGIIVFLIDFVNALVCVLYLAMIWTLSDLAFWLLEKFAHVTFEHYYAGWVALAITAISLMFGWYFAHNVWNTEYNLTTEKNIKDLRVVMFADSHIGTTFGGEEFAKHLEEIQSQNPDIVVVVGDYVDDGTTRENMIIATKNLGKIKTKYGTYFVFGNHDKGYYGSKRRGFNVNDLIKELTDNGITVLKDESILIDDSFYIIGRKDHSMIQERIGNRMSMAELIKGLDKNKYMIVLDHQPTDFKNQAESGVDLVLSGHTHGGQLFPFNQVGKWIGANDLVYGHEKRKNTDFIVTSGISDWAIKFKTGTKSEFVTINIRKEQ